MLDDRIPDTVRANGSVSIRRESSRHPVLADEVAVDFPSMRPIVERMLAEFLAGETDTDDPVTRHARFELTARQALEGVRLPLDLMVRHTVPPAVAGANCRAARAGSAADPAPACSSIAFTFRCRQASTDGARLRYALAPPGADRTHVEVRIAVQ